MKTAKIPGAKIGNPSKKAQQLINSQTKVQKKVLGAPQEVLIGKVEPAVFDIQYLKNAWNKLVKFFK